MDETVNAVLIEETTEEVVKPYKLRNLQSTDVYPMFKIISKIGIKEFRRCFESESIQNLIKDMMNAKSGEASALTAEDKLVIGVEIAFEIGDIILGNIPSCEEHINQLLSMLSGMSKKDISVLPLATYTEMIIDVIKMDDFKDFAQAVSKLIK